MKLSISRLAVVFSFMALILAEISPSVAVAASPAADPTPQRVWRYPGAAAQPSVAETDSHCYGLANASASNQTVNGWAYLDCTGSTITSEKVDVELYECQWGGTTYCGGGTLIAYMGPTCALIGPGIVWCPPTGQYSRQVGPGYYMVIAAFQFVDAAGGHSGSASSDIVQIQ